MNYSRLIVSILFGLIFLIIGIVDLPNYGPNWDEPVHFGRGQAILHYFLTGKKDYEELTPKQADRRSYYQHSGYTYKFFEQQFDETKKFLAGTGHPVVSDILAAVFNRIFYQTFKIIGDVESYHLYSITLTAILVSVLYFFISSMYGAFAGFISVLSLSLTPLLLGESRFNIKDVPETAFYAFTILTFYQGIIKNNWKWIILSSLFAGLAFGTKLNIVFGIVSIVIWTTVVFINEIKVIGWGKFFLSRRNVLMSFLVYPVIPLVIYFGSWPILWKDPINRFLYNLNYYKTIGTGGVGFTQFTTVFGINTYAIQWIAYTTPIVILFWTGLGITAGGLVKKSRFFFLLVLIWLFVPIVRVSLPKMSIYGGNRQIMEYIPAMAILAGIGANYIATWLKRKKIKQLDLALKIGILLSFLPITFKIIQIHPNESIYFNPLIGGLKGAAAKNIPWWGNSLGSTYRQGVRWLNSNAEQRAKVGFIFELRSNIPEIDFRPDIEFSNQIRTAIQRKGEYIIGVTHEATQEYSYHRKYLEHFLIPVYEVTVDGVPVLKIWKNDKEHSKPDYQKDEEILQNFSLIEKANTLTIDFGKQQRVTKITIQYPFNETCKTPTKGYFQHSKNGIRWEHETADITFFPLAYWFKTDPEPGILQFLFAAEEAQFVRLVDLDDSSCLLQEPWSIEVRVL